MTFFSFPAVTVWGLDSHECMVSVSARSSFQKKRNFINDSPRLLLFFCISLPNEFWELCAVVITTRCQLGNLYANGIGLGLISLPISQDLVAMGMPNSSSSHFYFFPFLYFFYIYFNFYSISGKGHSSGVWLMVTSSQVLRKEKSERGRCNLIRQVQQDFWNWCEAMNWFCAADWTASRQAHGAEAQVVRELCSGQDSDRVT